MGKIVWKGTLGQIWRNGEEKGDELTELEIERANRMHSLLLDGTPWEEARKTVDEEYDERIDKLLYPKGHKEKKKIEFGKWYPEFRILGMHHNVSVAGAKKYARLLIQKQYDIRFNLEGTIDIAFNPEVYPEGAQVGELEQKFIEEILEIYEPVFGTANLGYEVYKDNGILR